MKIYKLIYYVLSLILISSLLLTNSSCSGEKTDKAQTLRVNAPSWVCDKFKLAEAASQFMAENPGTRVVIDKNNNLDTSFYPLMNKSFQNKYDIIIGGSREHIVSYAESGMLMEFGKDFFDADLKKEDFFPSFLELGNIDGRQYMIPLMGELISIVIRKDLFEKAGLTDANGTPVPPQSWDQLYTYAKKLTAVNSKKQKIYGINIDFGSNLILYNFFASLQAVKGNIYDSRSSFIDISSKDVRNLLKYWQRLVRDGYAPTYTFEDPDAGRNNFKTGTVAMLITPHSRWIEISKVLGDENVGIMPLPEAEKNGSLTYIHGITIPTSSKNKELAIKFIKQKLLSRDFQSWTMENYGKIPSLIRNYEVDLSPEWNSILNWVRNAITLPLYQDWPKMDKILQQEMKDCITGKVTPDQAAERMKSEMAPFEQQTALTTLQ